MLSDRRLRILIGLVVAMLPPSLVQADDTKNPPPYRAFCIGCVKIRVGLPRVVRGPETFGVDSPFTEIKLPNDHFRGFFGGGGSSYAIDGNAPSDMGGPKVAVLNPGGPGSCNQSLQHVEPAGKILLGWIHNETACAAGRHKSMSLATSTDNGLTWHVGGPIITGRDAPDPSRNTGEGDCTAVNGGDGYYYAYCWRNTNGGTIVVRAPVANPGPGNWKKYFNGAWSEPGLGGDASKLDGVEAPAARWVTAGLSVNLASGGGLAFSTDHVKFTVGISEPLVIGDKNVSWNRPTDPHDLQAYWSLLDAKTGSNQLNGDEWNLFYLDLQPHEGFDKRYLVVRSVEVSRFNRPDEPRVATMLGHWHNAKAQEHWSTVAAVPGNYTDYKLEAQSGYVMTMADAKRPTVEIEDCVSQQGAHRDHILMQKNEACANHGYVRQRSAGWVFTTPEPGTQPLYRCYSEAEKSHFAANSEDCDHAGKMESLLGYDLKQ